MSKHIWIINEYAGSPYHGMEFRSFYLAKEWVKMGYSVSIISSSYSHVFKKQPTKKYETIDGVDFIWMPTLHYGNSYSKKRVLKWLIFNLKLLTLPFLLKKPDIVLLSPMAPFPSFFSYIFAKLYKAKFIYEVKDIWPLSIIELGGFSPKHPFIRFMSWFELFALKHADSIVSNLQNYNEHLQTLNIKKDFIWISNGVDLDELAHIEPLSLNVDLEKEKFIVGYAGAIGKANALDSFLESAKILQDNTDILFVVVGEGVEKENLMQNYQHLKNVKFLPSIPKQQVQSLLKLFDVCFIGLKKENLFRYGVSPNKLFDYMYSAKPILYAIDSGKNNLIKTVECGLEAEPENSQEIANRVIEFFNMQEKEREVMGQKGFKYVNKYFSYSELAKEFSKKCF